jgi:hypothetical protein
VVLEQKLEAVQYRAAWLRSSESSVMQVSTAVPSTAVPSIDAKRSGDLMGV